MASQEWTIYACAVCGFMDPGQYTRDPERPSYCPFAARGGAPRGHPKHPYRNEEGYTWEVEYVPITVVPKDTSDG